MNKIRCGIVGTGIIAQSHAEGILEDENATITAICDTCQSQIDYFEKATGINDVTRFLGYRDMISSGMIDAIFVCTPTVSHCEIACYAAEHHIHVFCEKPLAMNKDEAKHMLDTVKENKVVHMIGFAFRHIPAAEYIKTMVDAGRIGEIRYFRGYFFANRLADINHPLEWRHLEEIAGSGVIGDLISHMLDMAHYLFCDYDEIAKIQAAGNIVIPKRRDPISGKMKNVTAEETLAAKLTLKNNIEVLLEGSRYAPFEMGFHIAGTKGALKYNMAHYNEIEQLFYEKEGEYSQKYSQEYESCKIPEAYQKSKGKEGRFIRQSAAFIKAIRNGEQCTCNFEEGWKNQSVLDAIKQCAYKPC